MADYLMCRVYRSGKKEGMYLYVNKADELQRVPEALLSMFGKTHHAMDILLRPGRKLARADTAEVMAALAEPGYYLQTPPSDDDDYKLRLMGEYS